MSNGDYPNFDPLMCPYVDVIGSPLVMMVLVMIMMRMRIMAIMMIFEMEIIILVTQL